MSVIQVIKEKVEAVLNAQSKLMHREGFLMYVVQEWTDQNKAELENLRTKFLLAQSDLTDEIESINEE